MLKPATDAIKVGGDTLAKRFGGDAVRTALYLWRAQQYIMAWVAQLVVVVVAVAAARVARLTKVKKDVWSFGVFGFTKSPPRTALDT